MRKSRYICCDLNDTLLKLLQEWGGKYEIDEENFGGKKVVLFTIFVDDKYYGEIVEESYDVIDGIKEPPIEYFQLHYTKKELDSAEWLYVRSTTASLEYEREDESFDITCKDIDGGHRTRNENPLYIGKYKWNSRQHFNTTNYDVLFCDDIIKNLLESNCNGFRFENVYHYKTEKVCPDLFKIHAANIIEETALSWPQDAEEFVCRACGKVSHYRNDEFILHVRRDAINSDVDIWMTPKIFGTGFCDYSLTIISNKVFRLLRDNKLNRGLIFQPVILEE